MHITEKLQSYLGWCPNAHNLNVQIHPKENATVSVNVPDPDVPQPGDNPAVKSGFMDWFTAVSVVILFATLGFGGLFWWPFFVGAVLVADPVYWYFHELKGGC